MTKRLKEDLQKLRDLKSSTTIKKQASTKGKLAVNADRIESAEDHDWVNDGWIIAKCEGPDAFNKARRLVACWNALDGVPTEWLENYVAKGAENLMQENAALKVLVAKLDSEATDLANEILNIKDAKEPKAATPTPPAQIMWPPECEGLCKAAESFQEAVNELWKAQNPEELQADDTSMTEDEALENRAECWDYLKLSIHYMRKRMATPPAQEDEPVGYRTLDAKWGDYIY